MVTGYWLSQAVYVAAKLGLADLLKDGPRSAADLASATGTHARSLYRLLRALAGSGLFTQDAEGRFSLTALGQYLRGDVRGSQKAGAIMSGEEHYRAYAELLHCVRTGETAFDKVFGQPVFAYLASHPEAAQVFDDAMTAVHGAETAAMLDAYDFQGAGTLVDVGGGNGSLLIETLKRHPNLRGVLFDRPDVIERASPGLPAAGLGPRCAAVSGDFFVAVPPGGDAYVLRHIIHDWDDERSRIILKNCRAVLPPGGRVLVVESVLAPGDAPDWAKLLDLTMLVIPGGMERTEAEFAALLASAGLRLARVVRTRAEVCVIEGVPG
jgi:hypothetical protein